MLNSTQQQGFSLLELMIFFVLLAMLGAFMVPNIFRTKSKDIQREFVLSLENMIHQTVARAIIQKQVHQIYFDIKNQLIQVRIHDSNSSESSFHKQFKHVEDLDYVTKIGFDQKFKIKNFLINGFDEVISGAVLQDVMFYIMADGTSQPVVVNMVYEDEDMNHDIPFSFVINPFYARMMVYETFQTP